MAERLRVLVVDDDDDIRRVLVDVLSDAGHDASEARDGGAALELLADGERRPDVVLLDLLMPDMNGWQLLAAIRGHPVWCEVRVVVMTASRDQRLLPPADAYLRKPMDLVHVLEAIDEAAAVKRSCD